MLNGKFMRRHALLASLLLVPSLAAAEQTGGSSGGGGALGQVSSGMAGTSGGSSGGGGGGSSHPGGSGYTPDPTPRDPEQALRDPLVDRRVIYVPGPAGVLVARPAKPTKYDGGAAKIEAYFGAQKVHDSDGSWTAEVAIKDGLFRLGGTYTRYYERQPDDSTIRLSMPSLIGGVRVDDGGATRVYLELGFVGAKTSGDVMNSSFAGGLGGVRVEQKVSKTGYLTAEVHEMLFEDDLRAHSARIGFKMGIAQASFRVLDLNVGPALYGPEFGLRF